MRIQAIFLLVLAVHANSAEFAPPRTDAGHPGAHLVALVEMMQQAQTHAVEATAAESIDEVKQSAERIFAAMWGNASGLKDRPGAVDTRGWKLRWQVTYTDFDAEFAARYGAEPPAETNPAKLGIIGRGRYVRRHWTAADVDDSVIGPLNNVIGWMRIDDGVTKAERQPRIDLTYRWDAPKSFWQSTADTGWGHEVLAQAVNILKTDYGANLEMAREHAYGLVALTTKCLDGGDGTPGLLAAETAAGQAGLLP